MKITGKFTTMFDGQKVFDINIPCNSKDQKRVIITCDTKQQAIDFVSDFEKLLEKHTIESIESIALT